MRLALAIGARNLGRTWPNPSVGAVVVDAERSVVLAQGATQAGGRPHAERVALDAAGPSARGATLYVTLEPCSHHGRTPPCADAIVAAGIARVVGALDDPDPRVGGLGYARLRAAGSRGDAGRPGATRRRAPIAATSCGSRRDVPRSPSSSPKPPTASPRAYRAHAC